MDEGGSIETYFPQGVFVHGLYMLPTEKLRDRKIVNFDHPKI